LLHDPIEARFRCANELDEPTGLEIGDVSHGCGPRNLPLSCQVGPDSLSPGDDLSNEPLLARIYSLIYSFIYGLSYGLISLIYSLIFRDTRQLRDIVGCGSKITSRVAPNSRHAGGG
jgi:hypothetical protein